jgi:hypothetical protein
METLPRQEMDQEGSGHRSWSTYPSGSLDMVMRPEEKSRSRSEQCIGGCGVVMEMALARRDEEGQGAAAMTGLGASPPPAQPKQEALEQHKTSLLQHCSTAPPSTTTTPRPFTYSRTPPAVCLATSRVALLRSSYRVFWPANTIEPARSDCLLKPLHRDHVANRACIIAPLINETWLLPVIAPHRLPPKHSLPPWSS